MVKKRKNTSRYTADGSTKRPRLSSLENEGDDQARIDPTYGQRSAFPGLEEFRGQDELFYGPASDGLEYLRMVR